MPVSVQRLPGERILIATLTGEITIEDVMYMYQQSSTLIAGEEGVFHRITDTRKAKSSFPEMLKVLQRATQEMPAATSSGQVKVTFVGTTTWIDFIRNAFATRGIQMGAFRDMELALQAVRIQLNQENRVAQESTTPQDNA
jgi:hypothetical protein